MPDPLVTFHVPGIPRPKGSWKPVRNKNTGKTIFLPDSEATRPWQAAVTYEAHKAYQMRLTRGLHEGPVEARLLFILPRPQSVKRKRRPWPGVQPDLDKLERTILDALEETVLRNDGQVCRVVKEKRYDDDRPPGLSVSVAALTDPPLPTWEW